MSTPAAAQSAIVGVSVLRTAAGIVSYNGTPAAGNLVFSVAAAAFTDPFGNQVLAGQAVYQGATASVLGPAGQVTPYTNSSGQSGMWTAGSPPAAAGVIQQQTGPASDVTVTANTNGLFSPPTTVLTTLQFPVTAGQWYRVTWMLIGAIPLTAGQNASMVAGLFQNSGAPSAITPGPPSGNAGTAYAQAAPATSGTGNLAVSGSYVFQAALTAANISLGVRLASGVAPAGSVLTFSSSSTPPASVLTVEQV